MFFLRLIRYPNLLMLVITLVLLRNTIFGFENSIPTHLSDFNFTLFVLSTVCLAAGGYIINDIYDQSADSINKPQKVFVGQKISVQKAWVSYFFFSTLGLILGFYVCIILDSVFNAILCCTTFLLLFLYSFYFQKVAVLGNLIISFLIPLSMLALLVFEYGLESIKTLNNETVIVLPYLFFAFLTNLMRELIKDIEDIDGDYNMNFKTLPILIGKKRTRNITLFLTTILIVALLLIVKYFIQYNCRLFLLGAIVISVLLPTFIFFYQLWSAESKKDFHKASKLLKMIMVFGILTLAFIHH